MNVDTSLQLGRQREILKFIVGRQAAAGGELKQTKQYNGGK